MGIEEFDTSSESEVFGITRSGEDVRPYVDEATHELVRRFSMTSGMDIGVAYNVLIQTVLKNDELIIQVLEELANNGDIDRGEDLLDDMADKVNELNRFPSIDEVNSDDRMYGFPVYVLEYGSVSQIKSELVQKYDDISAEDLNGEYR